jgi:hypothetical protein
LKQVALALHLWASDQDSTNFPWHAQTPSGTASAPKSLDVFRHFAAISNELHNTRILTCPDDKPRTPATSWAALRNENISYFINHTPFPFQQDALMGDRHLSTNKSILRGYYEISNPALLNWTKDIHSHYGNVALADASVHEMSTLAVRSRLTNVPTRLAIP